jgi:putative NADH-flavin reductase
VRVALLGATGESGLAVARVLSERGHDVTPLARRPKAELEALPRVRVLLGDATDRGIIRDLLDGQDAVISALGLTAAGSNDEKVFVCTEAVRHILDEFADTEPRRLVVFSTHGVNDSRDDSEYVANLWNLMGERLFDKERMEQLLFAAPDVDWTLVRCPRIIDGRGSATITAEQGLLVHPGGSVHRELLAEFVVDALANTDLRGARLSVVG